MKSKDEQDPKAKAEADARAAETDDGAGDSNEAATTEEIELAEELAPEVTGVGRRSSPIVASVRFESSPHRPTSCSNVIPCARQCSSTLMDMPYLSFPLDSGASGTFPPGRLSGAAWVRRS